MCREITCILYGEATEPYRWRRMLIVFEGVAIYIYKLSGIKKVCRCIIFFLLWIKSSTLQNAHSFGA